VCEEVLRLIERTGSRGLGLSPGCGPGIAWEGVKCEQEVEIAIPVDDSPDEGEPGRALPLRNDSL
jgi:hypothetical protein